MPDPCTPVERTAVLVWLFCNGGLLTAHDVATRLGLSRARSYALLNELSRVIPIFPDDCGRWGICLAKVLQDKTA